MTSKSRSVRRASSIRRENAGWLKIDPTPCSALQGLALPGRYGAANGGPGVVLSERADLALAAVMVRKGASEALARRVRAVFGLDLPTTPRRAARGSLAFVWAGPGYWLAVTEGRDGASFEGVLPHGLSHLPFNIDSA